MQTDFYDASQNAVVGDGTNMMTMIMDDTTTTTRYINYRHRYLAPGGAEAEIDYTVVSVGVMTLGLLLVVEFVRHSLDHAAIGRPFFKAVLEGVYSECKCYSFYCCWSFDFRRSFQLAIIADHRNVCCLSLCSVRKNKWRRLGLWNYLFFYYIDITRI